MEDQELVDFEALKVPTQKKYKEITHSEVVRRIGKEKLLIYEGSVCFLLILLCFLCSVLTPLTYPFSY